MPRSEAVGRKWWIGISAVLVALGAFFTSMIFLRPLGSSGWLWGFALLLYMPFVLIGAAILKYLVIAARRLRHGS
jgi:hypothetical protein